MDGNGNRGALRRIFFRREFFERAPKVERRARKGTYHLLGHHIKMHHLRIEMQILIYGRTLLDDEVPVLYPILNRFDYHLREERNQTFGIMHHGCI